MIHSQTLKDAVGVQQGNVVDKTESTSLPSSSDSVIVGRFKRGRLDQPFKVNYANYEGLLGRDLTNPSYLALQDIFNNGVDEVWVQRIGASSEDAASNEPVTGFRFVTAFDSADGAAPWEGAKLTCLFKFSDVDGYEIVREDGEEIIFEKDFTVPEEYWSSPEIEYKRSISFEPVPDVVYIVTGKTYGFMVQGSAETRLYVKEFSPNMKRQSISSFMIYELPDQLPPNLTDAKKMLSDCYNIGEMKQIEGWNTDNITDMTGMFQSNYGMTLDLSNWNVENVVKMDYMFADCSDFNSPLTNWNPKSLVSANSMFNRCSVFNQPLRNWGVSKLQDTTKMFEWCTAFNGDLTGWKTDSMATAVNMFKSCSVFEGIGVETWNTQSLTDATSMFDACRKFNGDVSGWNTSSLVNASSMFLYCLKFNQPLNGWDMSKVTTTKSMLANTTVFNQPLDQWVTSSVTDMAGMFGTSAFNQDISGWDVSNVKDMADMFAYNRVFNKPLNGWNVSNVTDMSRMFYESKAFNQPLDQWVPSKVRTMFGMFRETQYFSQDLTVWCVPNVTTYSYFADRTWYGNVETNPFPSTMHPVWGTCPRGEVAPAG